MGLYNSVFLLCSIGLMTLCWLELSEAVCLDSSHFEMTFTSYTEIDKTWFSGCHQGRNFNLSNNKISIVRNDSFDVLWNVKEIDLSNNNISVIESNAFGGMRGLEILYLSNNSITALPVGLFYNKLWLKKIDLSYNLITKIPREVLDFNMPRLEHVILQHNLLTSYEPWSVFRNNISMFDVRFNNISTFTNEYNWTYDSRQVYDTAIADLRNNSISTWYDWYVMQYKQANSSTNAVEAAVVELMIDIRENPLMCDCNIYNLIWRVKNSFFGWSGNEFLDIICQSPPQLFGKKVMYEIKMSEFICDVTDSCPVGCTCEDRPDSRTLNVDCRGIGLTEVPDKVPFTPYDKISMQLDDNHIKTFRNVNYLPFVYSVTMSNNSLQSVPGYVMNEIASKRDDARVDFSNNALTSIPPETQNMKYEHALLQNNLFECSCEMLWMVDWINLAPIYTDKDLNCTFEGEVYSIISLDEGKLNCKNIGNIILVVVLSIVGVIVIALLITAKRCPYETKVLLYKVFRIHPSDKYQIDENNDKQYDMYVCFDENDTYVRQWVKKVLFRELEEKKPFYRLCAALRNAPSGPNAVGRLDLIDDSRRMLIILSEDCENFEWCKYEICHSETLEQNQGRIMYLLYDNCAEDFAKREPWLSKMKDRKTFRLHDRLLWSKLRYELPSKPLKRNIIAKHSTVDLNFDAAY
ncbi:hypothetical protein ACF0H5_000299 [Mactra antiquata]